MRAQSVYSSTDVFVLSGFIYNLPIIPEEIFKFFVPLYFSVMPAFNTTVTIAGVTVIAILIAVFILFRKKINKKFALLGLAIFFIPFLPVLIYKPSFSEYAYDYLDHRMIFPGIGLLLIAYALCESFFNKKQSTLVLSILLVFMSFISYSNTGNYKNYKTKNTDVLLFKE